MTTCTIPAVQKKQPEASPSAPGLRAMDPGRSSLLAWAGWQLAMPREWQPLKLSGTPEKGQMIVGDAECAIFIVKWERPKKTPVSQGGAWLEQRFRKLGVHPDDHPPAREQFTACGWAHDVQTEEGKETTYWYGYAEEAKLLIGITVNGVLPGEIRNTVVREVLPSLRVTAADAESTWAMYDVLFTAPAGFKLSQRHLFSGDIALEFTRGKRETLLLRQVYPGALALERKSFGKWLNSYPFKQHRRFRRRCMQETPWPHPARPEAAGMQRLAWKRLPVPLGWCSARRAHALAVHDLRLNRLLLVEHLVKGALDESIAVAAVNRMNLNVGAGA